MKSKINPFRSPAISGAAVVFACFTLLNPSAQAADQLWTGAAGDQLVNTAGNWTAAPDLFSFNKIVFGNDVVNGTMELQPWVTSQGITVTSGCSTPITINGSHFLNGAGGPIDMSAAVVDLTINPAFLAGWGDISMNVGAGRTLTLNGALGEAAGWAGGASLIKNGAGNAVLTAAAITTALSGSNNGYYSGSTIINAGTLTLSGAGGLPSGSALNLSTSGAALNISGISASGQTVGSLAGASGTSIILGGKNLTVGADNTSTAFGGVISGAGGSITKTGTGTMTLSGANTYSGVTTLAGGVLNVASISDYGVAGGLGNRAADTGGEDMGLLFQGGTLQYTGSTAQSTNRALRFDLQGGTIDASGSNPAATLSFTATTSPNWWANGGTRTFTLTGSNTGANTIATAINDIPGVTHFNLVKSGVGQWVLTGANTYDGTTTISGGTLEIGGAGTLGGGSYAGDISIATGGAFVYNSSANQDLTGIITGSGSITKNGSGTLTLTQALNAWPTHLFDGAITVNSGTLNAPDQNWQLNTASSITVNGGTLNTGSRSSEVGNLTLNGGTVASNGLNPSDTPWGNLLLVENSTVHAGGAAVSTISVDQVNLHGTNGFVVGAGSTLNVTSKIADYGPAQNLSKTGSGTLTLSGASTYTGATAVTEGKLVVNGNISTSVLTTVSSGATLGGSGSVGALTVNSGAFVTPGISPGILTVNGDYTQAGQYTAEIAGTTAGSQYDQIGVTGAVDISGGSLVTLFSGAGYSMGNLLYILLNDGTDAITGNYSGFSQGDVVASYGGFDWQISYFADSTGNTFTGGNDIALMAIPEPNAAALVGGFGLIALFRRRR